MNAERKPNETDFEYHKRLVYGKLVDKTLSDMDYSELSEKVYGQAYSSDVARRMMYGSRKTLDLISSMNADEISNKDTLKEIEAKTIELQKERQRFFDQRREYNKLLSNDGRKEHLFETLVRSAENLKESIGNIYENLPECFETFGTSDNEAVLVLSDWHYGMKTENIFNEYNTEICKKRVKEIVDSAIERIVLNKCKKLHIAVLGDLFHGAIHTSARVASEELVCDQIMQVSEILAQSILRLSKYVEHTDVHMTYGNHARTVQNKSDSIHKDNIERIIPWWLSWRLKENANIAVRTPSDDGEFNVMKVCGHWFCASHGDLDSVKSSPRLLTTLFNKKYKMDIEYILLGDKHHRESFEELGVTAFLCGSLCGADDYANDRRLFSTPSQMLLIVNKENGVDAEYRLKCE